MKKNFWVALVSVIFLSLIIMGYGIYVNYAGESTISDRMSNRAVGINAAVAKVRPMHTEYLIQEAKLEARNAVDVIAMTNGIIKESKLYKNKQVQAGELLVVMDNEELPLKISSAASTIKKAQASVIRTRNSYERYSSLMAQDATSQEKLDEARANYEACLADLDDAQAQYDQAVVNMNRLQVVAPGAGSVVIIYKQQGSFVTAGTPICMLADFSSMWFAINLPEYEVQALVGNTGMQSTFTLCSQAIGDEKAYNTEYAAHNLGNQSNFDISIRGIFPSLEEPADMRRVVFSVDNKLGILEPRAYNYLLLTANTPRNTLNINCKALFDTDTDPQYQYVYVVTADNTLDKREVAVGATNEKYAEILFGLQAGDKVVISGVDGLSQGQKVEIDYLEDE